MWKVSRKKYLGKNVLGEKIYKVWSIKFKKVNKVNVAIDHKTDIVLDPDHVP